MKTVMSRVKCSINFSILNCCLFIVWQVCLRSRHGSSEITLLKSLFSQPYHCLGRWTNFVEGLAHKVVVLAIIFPISLVSLVKRSYESRNQIRQGALSHWKFFHHWCAFYFEKKSTLSVCDKSDPSFARIQYTTIIVQHNHM